MLAVLETVGEKCARLLHQRLKGVTPQFVQVDEIWCYVGCKQRSTTPDDLERGDQYTFLAVDRASKLIVSHHIGKRNEAGAFALMADLSKRIPTRFQLTTDGFTPYLQAVFQTFGPNIDFSQLVKRYANFSDDQPQERRYSPSKCTGTRIMKHIGYPVDSEICTSHVERTNLNVRLFTRRFTRLTLGFSKKLDNLKHAVALFVAHYNFCRVHGSHIQTPAQKSGLTTEAWTIERLLTEASF